MARTVASAKPNGNGVALRMGDCSFAQLWALGEVRE
jgi:hypothetical protein